MIVCYFAIGFCAFGVSFWHGLLSLFVPFMSARIAMNRFPWLIWLMFGGLALFVAGMLCV